MPSSRRKRYKEVAPIDLEEMERDPGLRGMLSFLEISPEEKATLIAKREQVDRLAPVSPPGQLPPGGLPVGLLPKGQSEGDLPRKLGPSAAELKNDAAPWDSVTAESNRPMGDSPVGQQSTGDLLFTTAEIANPPYITLPGVLGPRRLHFCRDVQDAHTSGEIVAYQAVWAYAKKYGRPDRTGLIVDVSLSRFCQIWRTDHKNVKRVLAALEEKQNLEVIREPNCKLQIATRYRVFNFSQILERRRARGLFWVVRTRTTRFVDAITARRLFNEPPTGDSPMGAFLDQGDPPMGEQPDIPVGNQPEEPMGRRPTLLKEIPKGTTQETSSWAEPIRAALHNFGFVDDDVIARIVTECRNRVPDATSDEIAFFTKATAHRILTMKNLSNPTGLLITQVPRCFEGESFRRFREAEQLRIEAEERRENLAARQFEELCNQQKSILDDPNTSPEDKEWARRLLGDVS